MPCADMLYLVMDGKHVKHFFLRTLPLRNDAVCYSFVTLCHFPGVKREWKGGSQTTGIKATLLDNVSIMSFRAS